MAPKARRKSGLDFNAAYSASQPLFDTLRLGVEQLDRERNRVAVARDIVQNLHIRVVNEAPHQDKSCHEQYVRNILIAWRNSSKIYSDIFGHLRDITAANPTEGKPAGEGHDDFNFLSKNALSVHLNVIRTALPNTHNKRPSRASTADDDDDDFDLSEEQVDADEEEDDGQAEEHGDAQGSRKGQAQKSISILNSNGKRLRAEGDMHKSHSSQPPAKLQKSTAGEAQHSQGERGVHTKSTNGETDRVGIKYSESGTELWWAGDQEPRIPFEWLRKADQKQWRQEKRFQRKERRKARKLAELHQQAKAEAKGVKNNGIPSRNRGGDQANLSSSASKVEFEDVTAEASARLQAKADAKLAKKQQTKKKRKRESVDSAIMDGGIFDDALSALEASLAEKPGKKKPKRGDNSQIETHSEPQSPGRNPKRKHMADQQVNGREEQKSNAKRDADQNSQISAKKRHKVRAS